MSDEPQPEHPTEPPPEPQPAPQPAPVEQGPQREARTPEERAEAIASANAAAGGGQVVLDPDSVEAKAARGGLYDNIDANTEARDAELRKQAEEKRQAAEAANPPDAPAAA